MINLLFVLIPVSIFVVGVRTSSLDEIDVTFKERIVGGNLAWLGQFPYQVSIKLDGGHQCGGSIINNTAILSAAHCFYNSPGVFQVEVGSNRLYTGVVHDVHEIRIHKDYDAVSHDNDIAIVKLLSEIVYGSRVQPIGLLQDHVNEDVWCTISGWGRTQFSSFPMYLRYAHLRSISNEQCQKRVYKPIRESHLCTFTRYEQGVCFGDSGGALVSNGKIVGLASWVTSNGLWQCGLGYPDVFTRVSYYLDWINEYSR